MGKIISIKHNHWFNLGFFVSKWRFPFSHIYRLFQDSFIFGEATSSHSFRVTASTQQLLFRKSYFLRAAAFLRSSVFERIISLQQLFFQNTCFLRIGSSLGQLPFGTATFLVEEFFRIKIPTEEFLCQSRYFCPASIFSEVLHF